MKVALACDAFLPDAGGSALQLRHLAVALRADGIDAHIITAKGLRDDEVPMHVVRSSFVPGRSSELTALLRRERFDVVHSCVAGLSPMTFTTATIGARAGVASVMTFQAMLDRAAALLGASDALLGWTRGIVLTAVSSVVAAQAARAISGASVGVLPPGIDAPFWRSATRRDVTQDVHFVSTLESARGESTTALLRAFATAVRFVAGSPSIRLTIAGAEAASRSVSRRATEMDIGARVTLTGPLTAVERRALYGEADVFVLPGARDAFGLAALEARAAGLPIVAMLSSGARDFITPGLHGLLARDEAELARFMSRVAIENPLRRFMANRNRTEPPPYDWPLVVQMHRQIYDAAAALRAAPAPASHA